MERAVKVPTTIQLIEKAYEDMMRAYDMFEAEEDGHKRELAKVYYRTKLDIYRDICTEVVEKLMQINPKAIEDTNLWINFSTT